MTETAAIHEAVRALLGGGLIAYPTESVYGLGCDPRNEAALRRLLQIKNRIPEKGLILLVSELKQIEPWILPLSDSQIGLIETPSERATTWLIPCKESVSPLLRGRFSSLAVRLTSHPVAKTLCDTFSVPLVSTSCNHAGELPCRTAAEVEKLFKHEVDVIVEGECGHQAPSRILCIETRQVVR